MSYAGMLFTNPPPTPSGGLIGTYLPGPLADFIRNHLAQKVTRPQCECCGANAWTLMVDPRQLNDFLQIRGANVIKENSDVASWPVMGTICNNCSHIRWFAVQPIINAWVNTGGRW